MGDSTLLQYFVNNPVVMGDPWLILKLFLLWGLVRAFHAILINLIPSIDKKTKKFFFVVFASLLAIGFITIVIKTF